MYIHSIFVIVCFPPRTADTRCNKYVPDTKKDMMFSKQLNYTHYFTATLFKSKLQFLDWFARI